MKIFLRIISTFIIIIFISISYLSLIGIETKRFNNQISTKIKNLNENLEIDLKKIKISLNLLNLKLNLKTVGSKLFLNNKNLEIESIKTQISILSYFNNSFLLEDLEISTKSLEVKNLISFVREFYNTPQLYILEKFVKKGFLIADLELNFDKNGKIKNDYIVNGFIRDVRLDLFKDNDIRKLNLNFEFNQQKFLTTDVNFNLNNLNFLSEGIQVEKKGNFFLVDGQLQNKDFDLNEKEIKTLISDDFDNLGFNRIKFSSNNEFSFKINEKFQIKNLQVVSNLKIDELSLLNNLKLKNFFPKIKNQFKFLNHDLKVDFKNKDFSINGKGNLILQDNNDNISYSFTKKGKKLKFNSSLDLNKNDFFLETLNYKKNINQKMTIDFAGIYNLENKNTICSIFLKEKNNKLLLKNLQINKMLHLVDLDEVELDFFDINEYKNQIKITKKKNQLFLKGKSFNVDKIIENLLSSEKQTNFNFLNKNYNLNIDVREVRLDNDHVVDNFFGNFFLKENKITKANLEGDFSKDKKFKFTINSNDTGKVTTLFVDEAEPIIRRYKFIKGFENGTLDFYSIDDGKESNSTLKIYDFRLKELPTLTKILTLASLQGIADILSGEGIGFSDFEMNFKTQNNLITIEEIYAIGPAISILMEGYIEKNKLISLKGSLVPATTINKAIGSIPILGNILVGSKTGEGVFGVSFKIKGPPKNLETSVNPIKTLTPRFITRTLERIKKN